jgi:glycosyltransferase involved in cell wall biosynthesis
MSLGAPVIPSGVTSLPEIVGDAGILVDPRCEEAVYGAMLQFATDAQCRTYLRDKATRQAAQFSWPAAAQAVLTCYQEVLTHPRWTDHARRSVQ